MTSNHFTIKETDDFNAADFPEVVRELAEIKERVKPLRHVDNEIIIVSYLKDHMVRADLTRSHPRLVEVLTSNDACRYLEELFVSGKENSRFMLSLENYVVEQLNK